MLPSVKARWCTRVLKIKPFELFLQYIFLDEVTYIRHWDKGIKYLADAGILENVIMILTGSDLAIIKEARMRLPGRRGNANTVDFHLYPLSFLETVQLKKQFSQEKLNQLLNTEIVPSADSINKLFEAFGAYLIHGGFLTAINDFARYEKILPSTLVTYSDWIRGDVLKRGKQEHYLREILAAIIKRYGSQVTWNALSRDLSIDHPQTVSDYVALLATMDAVFVQSALIEDKLTAAPKKARKLMFSDPFIFHAVTAWLSSETDPYRRQITPLLSDPDRSARIVEACVATHYQRYFPTFYIKAKGEVDIAYVDQRRFWPLEIKWSGQIRAKDLKQVATYRNSRILSKLPQFGNIYGVPVEPLPLALLRLRAGLDNFDL
ncbi:MAG: ATP-binding protein [Deltaproteobacteria bacterium]|nr:MAG: ATP-binding protein [Deltaproteobacteria bacterium]